MDRLARRVIVLLLVVMILPTAVFTFNRLLGDPVKDAMGQLGSSVSDVIGDLANAVLVGLFFLGLMARIGRWWQNRDAAEARLRGQQQRRAQLAARRPAEDVPIHRPDHRGQADPDDPDPVLPFEDDPDDE